MKKKMNLFKQHSSADGSCAVICCKRRWGRSYPGMMLSAKALLNEVAKPTLTETRSALAGNLCRCTGYTQIFQAIERVACDRADEEPSSPSWAKPEEKAE